ncbi:hypothetical protein ACFFUS_17360 [Vibrio gallaecicus]|uniref:hypothetical protein n=1 Tax=Vibrio gallaecicus TaxID=552386 RepID=UPI0010C9591B|nr:hypothetical protein [Vibrio gallaecicus]MDN3614825.1 hypothetical protein [Vibrio gallaecicus]
MLNKVFLLCCFFPFVSPYPIESDIQPLAGIFASLIVVKEVLFKNKINAILLVVILTPIFLLVYNNPFSSDITIDLGKLVSLTFGAFIIVGFYYSKESLTSAFFFNVVTFYFVFTLLLLLFTGPMIEIQNLVIRNTNASDFTYRGVTTLVTEPGLFGGLLVFFLIVCDFLYDKGAMNNKTKSISYLMIMFMLLMTKSGTGYLYFILFIGFKYFSGSYKLIYKILTLSFIAFAICSLIFLGDKIEPGSLGRGVDILLRISNPATLIEGDSSILTRVVDFYLGLVSIFHYPFGVGNSATLFESKNLMIETPFVKDFYSSSGKDFGVNSSFTVLTISYGVIFWIYMTFLLFYFSRSSLNAKFFSFLYLSVSYSAAFPAIWILITLHTNIDTIKRNEPIKKDGL